MTTNLFLNDAPSPETALWRAVLFQAVRDATEPPAGIRQPDECEGFTRQARAYFTLGNPDFREVCTLAGVDPAQVCTLVAGLIASGSTLPNTHRAGRRPGLPGTKRRTVTSRSAPADRRPDERERARTYAREYARKRRAQLVEALGIEEVRRRERETAKHHRTFHREANNHL